MHHATQHIMLHNVFYMDIVDELDTIQVNL